MATSVTRVTALTSALAVVVAGALSGCTPRQEGPAPAAAQFLADLGRGEALNQVDAQNALIDSKNQRTLALVTHTIARLQFWKNMGILYIKENGQWEELNAPIN